MAVPPFCPPLPREQRAQCRRRSVVGQRRSGERPVAIAADSIGLLRPLIGAEEKQLLALDRPSEGSPELILPHNRLRLSRPVEEKIIRIQRLVPEKLEERTVKLIGSALGNDIDVGPCVSPAGSIRLSRLNLEFPDGVGIGNRRARSCGLGRVVGVRAVYLEVVIHALGAVDNDARTGRSASKRSRIVHVGDDAGRERQNLREVPRCQRKAPNDGFIDDASQRAGLLLHHCCRCFYRNRLRQVAQFKLNIQARRFGYGDSNAGTDRRLESG